MPVGAVAAVKLDVVLAVAAGMAIACLTLSGSAAAGESALWMRNQAGCHHKSSFSCACGSPQRAVSQPGSASSSIAYSASALSER